MGRGTTDPGPHITAWTEQRPAVLAHLQETGEFHADGRRVPAVMRPLFGWMRRQMAERLDEASGRPLTWLTVAPAFDRRAVCDWRCTRRRGVLCDKVHITPGKDWLQLSVPAGRLLQSDFALWSERVMAYSYVPKDEADDRRWQRRVNRELGARPDAPIPWGLDGVSDDTRRAAIASWPRIFDIGPSSTAVQATVEHLYLDDVVEILRAPAPADVPAEYSVNVSTYVRQPR
jgi:hypothetical protein